MDFIERENEVIILNMQHNAYTDIKYHMNILNDISAINISFDR